MTNDDFIANSREDNHAVFHARFWRCYQLLDFIAARVLGGPERAGDAVENCWLTASRNPPRFEHEGAFRSWLVRVLIDQALLVFRESQGNGQDQIALRTRLLPSTKPIRRKRTVRLKAAAEGEY
jgi:DNA-directed RNA polymerase specialized sigma24 family protein